MVIRLSSVIYTIHDLNKPSQDLKDNLIVSTRLLTNNTYKNIKKHKIKKLRENKKK